MPMLTLGLLAGLTLAHPISEVRQPPIAPPMRVGPPAPPPFAFQAPDSPRAPQVLVVVSCRADDFTGKRGRHGVDENGNYNEEAAAKGWMDLEPHVVNGELECKAEELPLEDAVTMHYPRKGEGLTAEALNSDFGKPNQCGRVGAFVMPDMVKRDMAGDLWAPVAIGCPSPIVDQDGRIVGWHLPGCPRKLGSFEGFTCRFTPQEI